MRRTPQASPRAFRPPFSLLLCALLGAALFAGPPARALAPEEEEELGAVDTVEPAEPDMRTRMVDTHDPNRAAHPLRIAAYALHPVGVTLDWVIVRPAVWVVKREPFRTIFGYED